METSEPVRLTNNGNAGAKFKFMVNDRRLFVAIPEEGEVSAGGFLDVKIVYKPTIANFTGTNSAV